MKINPKYNGTIIGGIFTLGSLILTLTFVVPIISIIPAAFIESLVSKVVNNEPYSNVGKGTLLFITGLFIIYLSIVLIRSRKTNYSNSQIVLIMVIGYFIIHSLGFYIYWAISLNFRGDGQLIFAAVESFPISSFGFIIIGLLVDLFKNYENKYSYK